MRYEQTLAWVVDNGIALKRHGDFERELLDKYRMTKTNHHNWDLPVLHVLFTKAADRKKLRAAGDPLPGPGPFTLYRGVAGIEPARKERGLSWTADRSKAEWFATFMSTRYRHFREALENPAVVEGTFDADTVLAYTNDRSEQEFIITVSPGHPLKTTPLTLP